MEEANESVVKKAYQKVKSEKIEDIRFVTFYFDYCLKIASEMEVEIGSYNEIMKKAEELGMLVYESACIWRLKIN